MFPIKPREALFHVSEYLQEDVAPVADEEAPRLWSVAITLDTLARQRNGMNEAVRTQRLALLDALDELDVLLDGMDEPSDAVATAVEDAHERLDSHGVGTDVYEVNEDLRDVTGSILDAIDADAGDETTAALRPVVHEFLSVRVDSHLDAIDEGEGILEITQRAYDDD